MRAQFSISDVERIKRELAQLLPAVKSSHRVEAMARGLGWNTNAALRAELADHQMERAVDDHAFTNYLKDHGFAETLFDALGEAVVRCKFTAERNAIEMALVKEATLTPFGLGVYDSFRKTREQRENELKKGREMMLGSHSVDQFIKAREFLSQFGKRAAINKKPGSSYELKHRAEEFHRDLGNGDPYVSNGLLIAAAIHLGFKIKQNGPNAYLNIGSKQGCKVQGVRVVPDESWHGET